MTRSPHDSVRGVFKTVDVAVEDGVNVSHVIAGQLDGGFLFDVVLGPIRIQVIL